MIENMKINNGKGTTRCILQNTLISALIMLTVITGTILLLVFYTLSMPAVSKNITPSEFSAVRAMVYEKTIAKQPHPTGSDAINDVAKFIYDELAALGLNPEIQFSLSNNNNDFAWCKNIIARLNGTDGTNAVLLDAHYDSVWQSNGAVDDGIGVATILETARALVESEPLKNDVIFLFTNPEESYLQGAIAFISEHPFAKDVKAVLSLDAGGLSGPVILMETSPNNKWLIKELVRSGINLPGNGAVHSFSGAVSDFNAFSKAGYNTVNISLAADRRIHSPLDNVNNIDLKALQNMGTATLSFVKHFGNINLDESKAGDVMYFNFILGMMSYYSVDFTVPSLIIIVLLFAGVIWLGLRKRILTISGIVYGITEFTASFILSVLAVTGIWSTISALNPVYTNTFLGHAYHEQYFWIAFIGIALCITTVILNLFLRIKKTNIFSLHIGMLGVLLLITIAMSIFKPLAGYLLVIPFLVNLLSTGFCMLRSSEDITTFSFMQLPVLAITGIITLQLFVPLVVIGFIASDTGDAFLMTGFIVMLCGFLLLHIYIIMRPLKWWVPLTTCLIVIISISIVLNLGFDEKHPQQSSLFYIMDSDAKKAYWGGGYSANNASLDRWSSQFFEKDIEKISIDSVIPGISNKTKFYIADAPPINILPIKTEIINDSIYDSVRTIHICIDTQGKADRVDVLSQKHSDIISVEISGVTWYNDCNNHDEFNRIFSLWGPPDYPFEIVVKLNPGVHCDLIFLKRLWGLSHIGEITIEPMPDDIIPGIYSSPLSGDTIIINRIWCVKGTR